MLTFGYTPACMNSTSAKTDNPCFPKLFKSIVCNFIYSKKKLTKASSAYLILA